MFGFEGLIAPLTLYKMFLAAGTILCHEEENGWVEHVGFRRFDYEGKRTAKSKRKDAGYESNETDREYLERDMRKERKKNKDANKGLLQLTNLLPKKAGVDEQKLQEKLNDFFGETVHAISDSEDADSESGSAALFDDDEDYDDYDSGEEEEDDNDDDEEEEEQGQEGEKMEVDD